MSMLNIPSAQAQRVKPMPWWMAVLFFGIPALVFRGFIYLGMPSSEAPAFVGLKPISSVTALSFSSYSWPPSWRTGWKASTFRGKPCRSGCG